MLDYKSIVRLKRLGLSNAAIANSLGCKWDLVQRIVSRCENVWGSVDGVPDALGKKKSYDAFIDEVETLRKKLEGLMVQPFEAEDKVRELNRMRAHESFGVRCDACV